MNHPRAAMALLILFLLTLSIFIPLRIRAKGQAAAAPLRLVQTITLPGGGSQIGHMSVDLDHLRLYVAGLGSNTVEIIDLNTGLPRASIANLSQPEDVLYERVTNRLFVASGADGTLKAFDVATSYSLLASIPLGGNISRIRYAPAFRQVVAGYGQGTLGLIDANTLTKVGEIGLGGHPEGFVLSLRSPLAFVNVPDARNVAVVDRMRRVIAETWPLTGLSQNYPIELDEANQRIFVGCRRPAMLQIFEPGGGSIGQFGIGADAGDISYDARHARIYVSCGVGRLDVIRQVSANDYRLEASLATAPGTRTSLFSPELNRLFVAVPRQGGRAAEIRVYEALP